MVMDEVLQTAGIELRTTSNTINNSSSNSNQTSNSNGATTSVTPGDARASSSAKQRYNVMMMSL